MSEFDLIRRYFQEPFTQAFFFEENTLSADKKVTLGIGDDCALLQVPSNHELAISMDTLVENVHFLKDTEPFLLGQRALRVCTSDLAAMGATALGFTLGLTLPATNEQWLAEFSQGLLQAARQFKLPLMGGDTTKGHLTITLQVHGFIPSGQALLRKNAQIGDNIYVSGTLGDGAAALSLIQGKSCTDSKSALDYFKQRFYQPEIAMDFAASARKMINSAIDVSDGLLADLNHIVSASKLGAKIDSRLLPLSSELDALVSAQNPIPHNTKLQWALSGGDDYRLCFTASPKNNTKLVQLAAKHQTAITCIGKITTDREIKLLVNNELIPANRLIESLGYSHF